LEWEAVNEAFMNKTMQEFMESVITEQATQSMHDQ